MINAQINLMTIETYKISCMDAIALSGILDESALPRLREMCLDMLRNTTKDFILDFSGVIKISNKVISLFTDIAKKLGFLQGQLLIMNLNDNLKERIELAKQEDNQSLKLFSNFMDAYRFLQEREQLYCF